MLQYRRRGSEVKLTQENFENPSAIAMLTYCNWSYSPKSHIDLETLKNILQSFNREYIPFYLRILNETPKELVESFLEQYNILKSSLQSIAKELRDSGFRVKDFN